MQFQYPEYGWFLLLIPLMVGLWLIWEQKKRKMIGKLVRPASLIPHLFKNYQPEKEKRRLLLFSGAMVLLIVAMMNPQREQERINVGSDGLQLMIALDVSNSMLANDIAPNRLEKARSFAIKLVEKLPGSRVGLVAFAGEAWLQMPATSDLGAVRQGLQTIQPEMMPVQGTNIFAALETALLALSSDEISQKTVVLITDGEELEGEVLQEASTLRDQGVTVYSVGVGSPGGANIILPEEDRLLTDENDSVVISKLDAKTLQKLSITTGGEYLLLNNTGQQVEEVFRFLMSQEKIKGTNSRLINYFSFAPYCMLTALILLLAGWFGPLIQEFFIPAKTTKTALVLLFCCQAFIGSTQSPDKIREANKAYKEQNMEKADGEYEKILAENPNNYLAAFNRAMIRLRKGENDPAAAAFEKLAKTPEGVEKTAAAWNNAGLAGATAGKLDEAIRYLKQAQQQMPQDPEILQNLQKALMEKAKNNPESNENPPPKKDKPMDEETAKQKLQSVMDEEKKMRQKMKPEPKSTGSGKYW
jgi:Ca-activated chloride channel family protein